MKRFYYLSDNIKLTEKISERLHASGINDWHFHVLSKDEAGLRTHHIHSANYFQLYDVVHSGERGALAGIVVGIIAAIATLIFQPFGDTLGIGLLALIIAVITMFGAWVGGLLGISTENYKIAQFHGDIERGNYLLMIDIQPQQEKKLRKLMRENFSNAKLMGEDTTFTNPFKPSKHLLGH